MNELKPCPYCGETKLLFENAELEPQAFVTCRRCGMVGPMRMEEIDAVTAWNALPRALVWTTEPPQAQGLYWVRSVCPVTGIASPAIAFYYSERECEVMENAPCQWAGPIPTPQGDPA